MAKQQQIRTVDRVLSQFSEFHTQSTNRVIQFICIPVVAFAVLGLIWAIPFPHLNFLGKYNGFVDWASFVIAFSIFYYYRLSPVLSCVVLLLVFAFSWGIVSLEKLHTNQDWPALQQACLILLMVGLILQFVGYKYEGKTPSIKQSLSFLLTGPLWLSYIFFIKFKKKY